MTPRHAAFIRNVMIGREGLDREVLLDIVRRAGATAPRSYISTGNVTFNAAPSDVAQVMTRIEAGIAAVIEREERVFVRSIRELESMVSSDPFTNLAFEAHDRYVSFTNKLIDPAIKVPFESGRDDIVAFGRTVREVFSVTRLVKGRATGPGAFIEKKICQPITTRNWNTIVRVVSQPE